MKALFKKMRKTTVAAEAGSRPAAPKREPRGLNITLLVFVMFLIAFATLCIAAGFTYLQMTLLGRSKGEALVQTQTQLLAEHLGSRVSGYAEVVAAAGHNPAIIAALSGNDAAALKQQAAVLGKQLPAVLGVRILPQGYSTIDNSSTPPLSYACLDLIRRAETQKSPPSVEVHLFGGKGQHMAIVRPVVGAQGVIGTILVTMDADVLKRWLHAMNNTTGGYLELRQGSGGGALLLATAGNSALQGHGVGYTAAVPDTAWQLVDQMSAPVPLNTAQRVAFFAVFGVAAVALIVAFMAMGMIISRIVRTDLVAVVKQAIDMVNGGRQHNFEVRLAESREVLRALEQHVQPRQVQPDFAKAAAMREESGIVVDEESAGGSELSPSVLFMDKNAVEVKELSQAAPGHNDEDKQK